MHCWPACCSNQQWSQSAIHRNKKPPMTPISQIRDSPTIVWFRLYRYTGKQLRRLMCKSLQLIREIVNKSRCLPGWWSHAQSEVFHIIVAQSCLYIYSLPSFIIKLLQQIHGWWYRNSIQPSFIIKLLQQIHGWWYQNSIQPYNYTLFYQHRRLMSQTQTGSKTQTRSSCEPERTFPHTKIWQISIICLKMPSKWENVAHNGLICFFQHNYIPTFEQWLWDRVCVISTWFGDICCSRRDFCTFYKRSWSLYFKFYSLQLFTPRPM